MKTKQRVKALVLCMVFSMLLTIGGANLTVKGTEIHAASIKISKSSISLKVGKTKKLSLKNTKKKATWSSSNPKVATVTKAGKVKAISAGTTTITAKLSGKSYTCKVTVRNLTVSETLTKIHNQVKKAYGDSYLPNMKFDSLYLQEVVGLSSSSYDAVIAEGPMMSHLVDTFIAVHAVSGKAAEVESILNAYRSYLINDTFQYPINLPKLQASKVVRKGDYVFFLMLGKNSDSETSESKLLTYYKEQTQLGVNVITKVLGN